MSKRKNPGKPGSAFKRCVKSVSERGGAVDPRAVCAAAGRKKYGKQQYQEMAEAGKRRKKRRGNPADEAADAYEQFHGRPSEETVTITKQVHFHGHLAAIGKLEALHIETRDGSRIKLKGFKGAILCQNEKGTQLFVEGGDQWIDTEAFGLSTPHEKQDLGCVHRIEYFTTKDHLGSEGGTAVYVHDFEKPYPHLVYDTENEQLEFVGGKYVILPEGIDH